jgi:hypothetical protein
MSGAGQLPRDSRPIPGLLYEQFIDLEIPDLAGLRTWAPYGENAACTGSGSLREQDRYGSAT